MPYKNLDKKKEYHRQYMAQYNKTKPPTDEQKKRKSEYMRMWVEKNKERVKEISRNSYLKNKEKRSERSKQYRLENKEAIKEKKHKYYERNKDIFAEKAKTYYRENLDSIRVYKNQYAKTPKGKYISYQVSAKTRKHDFELTEEEFKSIFSANCHYCGKSPANGIDRKDSSVGYLIGNSLPCCKECNLMKRDMTYEKFLTHIQQIIKHLYQ